MSPHIPMSTLSYRLTRADALAWTVLRREVVGGALLALILWFALAGGILALLPVGLTGEEGSWRFWAVLAGLVAVQYALLVAGLTWRQHWRAARMLPQPQDVQLEIWGDHLSARQGARVLNVAPETIRQVVVTESHVFLDIVTDVLIVPLRAFADAAEMAAFGALWDDLSRNAAA